MKKKLITTLILLVSLASLTGCGGEKNTSTNEGTTEIETNRVEDNSETNMNSTNTTSTTSDSVISAVEGTSSEIVPVIDVSERQISEPIMFGLSFGMSAYEADEVMKSAGFEAIKDDKASDFSLNCFSETDLYDTKVYPYYIMTADSLDIDSCVISVGWHMRVPKETFDSDTGISQSDFFNDMVAKVTADYGEPVNTQRSVEGGGIGKEWFVASWDYKGYPMSLSFYNNGNNKTYYLSLCVSDNRYMNNRCSKEGVTNNLVSVDYANMSEEERDSFVTSLSMSGGVNEVAYLKNIGNDIEAIVANSSNLLYDSNFDNAFGYEVAYRTNPYQMELEFAAFKNTLTEMFGEPEVIMTGEGRPCYYNGEKVDYAPVGIYTSSYPSVYYKWHTDDTTYILYYNTKSGENNRQIPSIKLFKEPNK